jgi:hypothetical protein
MNDCYFMKTEEGFWQCQFCEYLFTEKTDEPPRGKCMVTLTPADLADREKQKSRRLARGSTGDQLHLLILRLCGQDVVADCGCRSYIAKMNAWGVEGCRRRIDRISRHLLVEAHRRGLTNSKIPTLRWVKRIGAKPFCRWLVKRAIRRAEKARKNAPPSYLRKEGRAGHPTESNPLQSLQKRA